MNRIWIPLATLWCVFMFIGAPGVPALGPLFSARGGIWDHRLQEVESRRLKGLAQPVVVTWDKHGVPHFFAKSKSDLFLAQGFVTASQRLFQMDLATRLTSSRLSELVGARGLELDRFFARFGMRQSAQATWEKFSKDADVKEMFESYIRGVNLHIESLSVRPPEYKLLGQTPEPFTVLNPIHMKKALTFFLTGRSFDIASTQILRQTSAEKVLDLFPEHLPSEFENYIHPGKFSAQRDPETADTLRFVSGLQNIPDFPWANPGQGSNNWAVAAAKSESGTSLFANDTHLGLQLPSMWYENQLSCPEFNVYGTSLVNVPGIINGFNKDVVWGPTNGTTDVLDFYEIEFEDESSLRYKAFDGWRQAEVEDQVISRSWGGDEAVQVTSTHLGFLIHREGKLGLVADWLGHQSGEEFKAIFGLFTAKSAEQCIQSFKVWQVPIQNFLCADQKNISWRHAGLVPLRKVGEGRIIMDGRSSKAPMQNFLLEPIEASNPAQGFLQSANQKVLPPGGPFYLGWDYEPPFRGMAISRTLSESGKFSAHDMMALQTLSLDTEAEMILPGLLHHLPVNELNEAQTSLAEKLSSWDFRVRADQTEPAFYKQWLRAFKRELFDDDYKMESKKLYPRDARVAWLLQRLSANPEDSDSQWVDKQGTEKQETLEEVTLSSFRAAWSELSKRFGSDQEKWNWAEWNNVSFAHVARIPGFGSGRLSMDGSTETVRGLSHKHGAVYQLVVETGDWPNAWILVPGGNHGDPFRPEFENFLPEWSKGKMRPVEFYRNETEARARAVRVIEFTPGEE